RLVVDFHEVGRVLGQVATLGDHQGDRLARVADDLARQASLGPRLGELGMWNEERQLTVAEGNVGRRVDGDHAGRGARGADVDGADPGGGEGRADEGALEGALADVIGEPAAAAEEAIVLLAGDALAEETGGHARISSAARRTLRRM